MANGLEAEHIGVPHRAHFIEQHIAGQGRHCTPLDGLPGLLVSIRNRGVFYEHVEETEHLMNAPRSRGNWFMIRHVELARALREESWEQRAVREVVLSRLLEVLLIEALRSTAGTSASPGLLSGLTDSRLEAAIRVMQEHPDARVDRGWARQGDRALALVLFERFNCALGVAPMECPLTWRMALAKDLLLRNEARIAEIAQRVGYSSASTFSVAFTRLVGKPPRSMRVSRRRLQTTHEPARQAVIGRQNIAL